MLTLVISDIHNRVYFIEKLIKDVKPDLVVFLGDYFDEFWDTPADAQKTAKWLKKSLGLPNRIHLLGNHDMPYFFSPERFNCPGYTKEKGAAVSKVFKGHGPVSMFHLVAAHQGFIFSHAGILPSLMPQEALKDPSQAPAALCNMSSQAITQAKKGKVVKCLKIGSLFSKYPPAGLTWLHWGDFTDIPDIPQIVGHTSAHEPREKGGSICLDTDNRHFLTIKDSKPEVHTNHFWSPDVHNKILEGREKYREKCRALQQERMFSMIASLGNNF